jgi:hypothetical protein
LADYIVGLGDLYVPGGFLNDQLIDLFDGVVFVYLLDIDFGLEVLSAPSFIAYTGAHIADHDDLALARYGTIKSSVGSPESWMEVFYTPTSTTESQSACRLIGIAGRARYSPFIWGLLFDEGDCPLFWAEYQVSGLSYAAGYIEYLGVQFGFS